MKIAKWGNALAVGLPAELVRVLGLNEGESVDLLVLGAGNFGIARRPNAAEMFVRLRDLRGRLPMGVRFDRLEANTRD